MNLEEKIKQVLANTSTCPFVVEHVIAQLSLPESPISEEVAEWLKGIGVEDPRIALDDAMSSEERLEMFRRLMDRYRLNNQATAAMLGCSVALIASYRSGVRMIPIHRLRSLKCVIDAIDRAVKIED